MTPDHLNSIIASLSEKEGSGASASGPGSSPSDPNPSVSAHSGDDPSREEMLAERFHIGDGLIGGEICDLVLAFEGLRHEIINSPETADFMSAVPIEAAHQRDRWGSDHDAGKEPQDWFWLLGYLAGKALRAASDGDLEKAKHHTISSAAALANWHAALAGASNVMRPGTSR